MSPYSKTINWDKTRLDSTSRIWELYHENSKQTPFDLFPNTDEIKIWKNELSLQIPFATNYNQRLIKTEKIPKDNLVLKSILKHSFDGLADAICPIEILIHLPSNHGGQCGLYHFNPENNQLMIINHQISPQLSNTEITILATCFFEKLTTPYGERGYRNALLMGGRVLQNLLLAARVDNRELNIKEIYMDREIEDYLKIDGINHSLIAVGTIPYTDNNKL